VLALTLASASANMRSFQGKFFDFFFILNVGYSSRFLHKYALIHSDLSPSMFPKVKTLKAAKIVFSEKKKNIKNKLFFRKFYLKIKYCMSAKSAESSAHAHQNPALALRSRARKSSALALFALASARSSSL
jgi:hypothetical protein